MDLWKHSFRKAFFAAAFLMMVLALYLLVITQAGENTALASATGAGKEGESTDSFLSVEAEIEEDRFSLKELDVEWVQESEGFTLSEIEVEIIDGNQGA